jgi:Secretion system C-terminal sorting domain/WD40-like Beta Propeller Repeat
MPTAFLLRFCLCSLLLFTLVFETSAQRAGRRRSPVATNNKQEDKSSERLELSVDCRETNKINKAGIADSYPYLTEDGLRLYFTSNREKGHGRFFISTRKSMYDPFDEPKVLSRNLTDGYYAGTLTADELTLCMVKSGKMYISIRADKNGEFPSPIKIKGASDDYHFGPSISQDGKEIIVTVTIKGKDMIRVYERTDIYTVKVKTTFDFVEGSDPGPGQLSKDGLSYYFSLKKDGNEHLWRYTRKSITDDIFTNLEELPEQIKGQKNILQPSLNADGSVMMFVTSPGNLWDEDDIKLVNHFKNDFVYHKIADSIVKDAGNTVAVINKISSPQSIEYSTILKEDLNTWKQSKRTNAIDQSLVQLKIYPNPFTAAISIELKEVPGHGVLFNLYDQTGKIIRQEKINNTRTNLSLNNLSAGVYTYQVIDEKGKLISSGKLVKGQ